MNSYLGENILKKISKAVNREITQTFPKAIALYKS